MGQSLAETMEQIRRETTIDPEEDLNKLDDKELAKKKSIMDELFEKNQKDDSNLFMTSKLSSHRKNNCSPMAETQS